MRRTGLGAINIDDPYQGAYGIYGSNSGGYVAPIKPGLWPHTRELYNTDMLWDVQGYADRQPVPVLIDDEGMPFTDTPVPTPYQNNVGPTTQYYPINELAPAPTTPAIAPGPPRGIGAIAIGLIVIVVLLSK